MLTDLSVSNKEHGWIWAVSAAFVSCFATQRSAKKYTWQIRVFIGAYRPSKQLEVAPTLPGSSYQWSIAKVATCTARKKLCSVYIPIFIYYEMPESLAHLTEFRHFSTSISCLLYLSKMIWYDKCFNKPEEKRPRQRCIAFSFLWTTRELDIFIG